ncbi:MAG: AtpZ/AtpI family protein [Planctomycetota bacterium]
MRDKPPKRVSSWMRYAGVGIDCAAAMAGFALIGYWIDRHYQTKPWGLVIGAVLGLVGGTYNLIRVSLAAFRRLDDEAQEQRREDESD